MKRRAVVAIVLIGVGLMAAPAVFKMFGRAPLGGQMINEFEQFMQPSKVAQFQGYMKTIDAAHEETSGPLPGLLSGRVPQKKFDDRFPATAAFNKQWPAIYKDMNGGMLTTMDEMIDNFAAVNALPPFPLFPWFFVAPGLIIALLGRSALKANRKGAQVRGKLRLLALMGIGLIAAPAIFQMLSRAPLGAEMIDEFRPLMTNKKLATVQGYFLTLGAAEGEIRNEVLPMAKKTGLGANGVAKGLPAVTPWIEQWPTISKNMAPMIGAMADNIDNYEAVDALPSFSLFPWFFVAPGVLVAGLALAAGRSAGAASVWTAGPKERVTETQPKGETQDFFEGLKQKAAQKRELGRIGAPAESPGVPTGASTIEKGE